MFTVLLIEDTKFIRQFLKIIFKRHNFLVVGEADNINDGIRLYKSENPDLIIMDMVLKGKSGLQGIKEIIKIDQSARILVCTSLGSALIREKVLNAGASDYIIKPFKEEKLLKKIKSIFEGFKNIVL
ncbi:MAG: response regulator [Promethearchaeota archaeon]